MPAGRCAARLAHPFGGANLALWRQPGGTRIESSPPIREWDMRNTGKMMGMKRAAMATGRLCAALTAWFAVGAATQQARAAEAVLENASMRVVFRNGRLASLLDKGRSIEHAVANADKPPGLFQVQ